MAYGWAYRWATLSAIVSFVALWQLVPAARASEPGLARASVPGWSASNPSEFQALVGDRVFFAEGSAELGDRARRALAAQAAWLARHPALPVTVEGHADDPGGDDHRLSEQRAEAVRRRLIAAGIARERIRTVAYGRRQLIAQCGGPRCGPQNRRAVTVVGWPTAAIEAGMLRSRSHETIRRSSPRLLY
jgi:outer membrane protein OmpA-like peptidoglycan-associated protein